MAKEYISRSEELIKRYGKRHAFEWFVRTQDEWYCWQSQRYTDKKVKRITALAVTNAVITVTLVFIYLKRLMSQ